jgi:endothelin-converting enzyme/membrane metallo-endopeptidase-like protein 1
MYLNYGAMGSVIGHEITHGFDDEGSQFDAYGNLENWWSNDTLQHFHNLSQCFIDQYSGITDDRVNLTLNGKNTLGENIADNGGAREAFEAYINLNMNEPSLPGLSNYTNEQLFFVAYANTWCSVTRNEKLRQNILYDPHSPAKYRVNLPFANYDVFSEVWKCPCHSQMNKGKERCVVW